MSNCRTVEEARAWMTTRGIRQLGTEHLTQNQKRVPDFRDGQREYQMHPLHVAQQDGFPGDDRA